MPFRRQTPELRKDCVTQPDLNLTEVTMNYILNQLRRLSDDELICISEAIDIELDRRLEVMEEIPDSAKRRAVKRQKSYRRSLGSSAPPIRAVGLKDNRRKAA
jgi:hypothetical protein